MDIDKDRFKAGQTVGIRPGSRVTPAGTYQIVRALPTERDGKQYRVRRLSDGHERVVHETELTGAE